ncbi:MAG: adenylyl-sulfate kinase [Thermoplasmata archaeon]
MRGVMLKEGLAERKGFVVWLEGLSGSGKTTLSQGLATRLRGAGWKVELLDGDEVRRMFSPELGFTRKDREFHARRVSYVARMLARNGVATIVAMITPYETSRQAARADVETSFEEIWLRCPLEICQARDPKGIYHRAAGGEVHRMTGLDDPFEEPLNPDLTVDTANVPVGQSLGQILEHLANRGLIQRMAPPA